MRSLKFKKNFHCSERFVNRLLKNGKKHTMFRNIKNVLYLFGIYRKHFKRKNLRLMFFAKKLVVEELLYYYLPEYSVSYRIKKDRKEKKKNKTLAGTFVKIDKEITELYKWWYLLFYKMPIRTMRLRVFYFFLLIYLVIHNIYNLEKESKLIFADSQTFYTKKHFWKKIFFKRKKRFKKLYLKDNVKNIIWTSYLL